MAVSSALCDGGFRAITRAAFRVRVYLKVLKKVFKFV